MTPNDLAKLAKDNSKVKSGIYMIYCLAGNKAYIGQSKNIKRRWIHHKYCLNKNVHPNNYLQNLYNKYGLVNFIFVILEECLEQFAEREAFYLNLLDESFRLNLGAILDLVPVSSETRKKHSMLKFSEESKQSISKSLLGNKRSLGFKHSEETKLKMSLSHKASNHPFFGKTHSEASKKKMSESAKGRRVSIETKEKMSIAQKKRRAGIRFITKEEE